MKLDGGLSALQALGIDPLLLGAQFDALLQSPHRLAQLQQQALARHDAATQRFLERYLRQVNGRRPRMPNPAARRRAVRGYHRPMKPLARRVDLADIMGARRKARRLERALRRNPKMRRQIERALGGRIRMDRTADGKLRVVRRRPRPQHLTGSALTAQGYLDRIQRGGGRGSIPDQYLKMMLGGLAKSQGKNKKGGGAKGGRGLQGTINAVLHDPALTVEDKVTLMIMLIMKKMDRDIEKMAKYINSLQQQQGGKSMNAGNTAAGSVGDGSNSSIDVETMKLKRLIDKRSQMFDMLRQIIDKYNETAKNLIQSIAR